MLQTGIPIPLINVIQLTKIGYQFLIRAKYIFAIVETSKEEILDSANSYPGIRIHRKTYNAH